MKPKLFDSIEEAAAWCQTNRKPVQWVAVQAGHANGAARKPSPKTRTLRDRWLAGVANYAVYGIQGAEKVTTDAQKAVIAASLNYIAFNVLAGPQGRSYEISPVVGALVRIHHFGDAPTKKLVEHFAAALAQREFGRPDRDNRAADSLVLFLYDLKRSSGFPKSKQCRAAYCATKVAFDVWAAGGVATVFNMDAKLKECIP
jgi:hypothetical protein